MKSFCLLLAVLAACPLLAERQPLSRYQSVIDRQMFGEPPEGFDPTKPASEVQSASSRKAQKELTKEQEQVKSSVHLSMINVTPEGNVMVGFTDKGNPKQPVHYYLRVGETRDGWLVKEADPVAKTMTIARDDVEVFLELGGDSASGKGGSTKRAEKQGGRNPLTASSSLRGRRRARQAEQNAQMGKLFEEMQRKHERQLEEAKASAEEERAAREEERKEQRKQLLDIQVQLRKAREERENAKANSNDNAASPDGDGQGGEENP